MAERLTRNNKVNFYFHDEASNMVYYKLQGLEDILKKYGIESVEELEELLDDNKYAQNVVVKQLVELKNAKTDRNTWKRACELASSHISWCPAKQGECNCTEEKRDCTNYFFQQAKKDGNDE